MADLQSILPASVRASKYLNIADELDYGSATCPIAVGSLYPSALDEIYRETQEAAHAHDAIAMRVLNSHRVLEAIEAAARNRAKIEASLVSRPNGGIFRGWSATMRLTNAIRRYDSALDHLRKVLNDGYAKYVGCDTEISPDELDLLADLEELRAA
jgi:hypothetical protein